MANPVPKNVAAVLGLVPTVLGGARRLPAKAVQIPVIAIGSALSGIDAAKREYDDLAERGERLIARLRGSSLDETGDSVGERLQAAPVATLHDKAEDAVEGLAKVAGRAAQNLTGGATANAKTAVQAGTAKAKDRAEASAAVAAVQETVQETVQEELPVQAPAPTSARVDSAASPEVIEQVDRIAANVNAPLITAHSDLPLADYDHMTLGSLRGRLRSLDMQQLVQLRDYEKSKADRLPVVTMLDNRIAKLSNGQSMPSGAATPEPSAPKPPKKVGATAAGNTDNSPPHGKVRYT
ncbi:MAG: hypothetical protein NVSMB55_24810 [Mycobacteriales bacterium]